MVTNAVGSATKANAYTYTDVAIIFLTNGSSAGNVGLSTFDARCNTDGAKPTSGFAANYTYKALLNGNNATAPGRTYYQTNGTTVIATATSSNLVGSSNLQNAINTISSNGFLTWTGGSGETCSNWTNPAGTGSVGLANSSTSTYWSNSTALCTTGQKIYCVSQ